MSRTQRLRLIAELGRRRHSLSDSWRKLAVGLAIAALYSEEIGDDTWIINELPPPPLNALGTARYARKQQSSDSAKPAA